MILLQLTSRTIVETLFLVESYFKYKVQATQNEYLLFTGEALQFCTDVVRVQ